MITFPYRKALQTLCALALLGSSGTAMANTAVIPDTRPGRWMEQHESHVRRAQAGCIDLLFLGDSITDFWPKHAGQVWQDAFISYNAANFGISGDRTQHLLWRLQNGAGEGYQPKVVVLMIGTNNTGFERETHAPRNTAPEAIEGVRAVVKEVQTRFPNAKLLLFGLLPRNEPGDIRRDQVNEINAAISQLHDGEKIYYFDIGAGFLDEEGNIIESLMPDRLHPSAEGYKIWAAALEAPLKEFLY